MRSIPEFLIVALLVTLAPGPAKTLLRPRVQRAMERVTGAVMIGLGVRLALESR